MKTQKWLSKNTSSLQGKTIAVTGSTGGIGRELCRHLAMLGADLVLLDRNPERSEKHKDELEKSYDINVSCITTELEDTQSVINAARSLEQIVIDALILNAGAYKIPRHECSTGYDNIFQINFASPLLLVKELLPHLRQTNGKIIAVSSIAHRYSKVDASDIDFKARKSCALAYGNSKRFLTFSLYELFKSEDKVTLSITHPGITLTNITSHFPKIIFALIKNPMKIIFMSPNKASLCVLKGVFEPCSENEWIGPRLFDIWGKPKKKKLRALSSKEQEVIYTASKSIGQ